MNVAPVYYGLNNGNKPAWMDMVSAPPSDLNAMLANGDLDVSPVSSAAYARNQDDWILLPDLSISCFGKVMSVLLVSKYPFEQLTGKTVILTRESATAAALSRYLFASRNVKPGIETGKILCACDFREDAAAALVIGDSALKEKWASHYSHVWDLGEMWKKQTGLPFVFALWAARKSFAYENPEWISAIVEQFYLSRCQGKKHILKILPIACKRLGIDEAACTEYYKRLHYSLNPMQIKGLEAFFNGLYQENIIPRPVKLSFFQSSVQHCLREYAA